MSRIPGLKSWISIFVLAVLMMSVASPALAQPSATPVSATGRADKEMANISASPPAPTVNVNIGNLKHPPSIVPARASQIKKQVNSALLNLTKRLAVTKIAVYINLLEVYKKRVSSSALGNDQKSGIIAVIDTNIAWLRQAEADVQAAGDVDAIRGLMAQVDQQAESLKVNMRRDAGILACDSLDARIAAGRNASTAIAGRIAAMEARGVNADLPDQKLAAYGAHLDAAARCSAAARAAFEGITTAANADAGFAEGYKQIGQADREMFQAYADLKAVYLWYLQKSR